jgi:hypothetical protein
MILGRPRSFPNYFLNSWSLLSGSGDRHLSNRLWARELAVLVRASLGKERHQGWHLHEVTMKDSWKARHGSE